MKQLNICEIYSSVHGESTLMGLPCTIVRTQGCSRNCVWCDSPFSKKAQKGQKMSFTDILNILKKDGLNNILVSGGEPLEQEQMPDFLKFLLEHNYAVALETNGTEPIDKVPDAIKKVMDIKCPGSGTEPQNHYENLAFLKPHDEVKFVLKDRYDFDWAQKIIAEYGLFERVTVLFSCVFGQLDPQTLIQWILQTGAKGRLQMQLHKFIWAPETRGV